MNHKPRILMKGLLAGALVLGASAMLASPAMANDVAAGSLTFSSNSDLNGGAPTSVTYTAQDSTTNAGTVVIDGGASDITVTQNQLTQLTEDVSQITIGQNYAGEITFQSVNLKGATGITNAFGAVITVSGQPVGTAKTAATINLVKCDLTGGGGNTNEGYSAIELTENANGNTINIENCELAGGSYTGYGNGILISAKENTENTINFSGTNTVQGVADQSAAISLAGTSNKAGTLNVTFEASGTTLVAGNTTTGAIDVPTGTTQGILNVETLAPTTITGYEKTSTSAGGPAINLAGVTNVNLTGEGALAVSGGDANTTGTGGAGIALAAAATVSVGAPYDPGNVSITGGNGAGDSTNAGGPGINNTAAAATVSLNSGSLTITGGVGASSTSSPGTGGNAIEAATNIATTVNVYDGTLDLWGGAGGANTTPSTGAQGGAGINVASAGTNAIVLNVDGGEVTATGGTGGGNGNNQGTQGIGLGLKTLQVENNGVNSQGSYGPVINAYGSTAISLSNTPTLDLDGGVAGRKDYYPYVAQGTTTSDSTPQLILFAGQDATVNAGAVFNNFDWVEISPHALETVTVDIVPVVSPANPVSTPGFVLAMGAGQKAPCNYTINATGTFEDLPDLNTSRFSTLYTGIDLSNGAITPEENVNWVTEPSTSNPGGVFNVPETAKGNFLTVNAEGTAGSLTNYYPDVTFTGENQVPVVYTIALSIPTTQGTLVGGSTVRGTSTRNIYTSKDGKGNLVLNLGGPTTDQPILTEIAKNGTPNLTASQINPTVTNWAQVTPANSTTYPTVIGAFNGETQVPLTQVSGWDSNAALSLQMGSIAVTEVAPSSATLEQGADTDITATLTVTAADGSLTGWTWDNSGLNPNWMGYLLSGTGGTAGSAAVNGVTLAVAPGTTSNASPFTCDAVGTVSASGTATLGEYVIYPSVGNNTIPSGGSVTDLGHYSTIKVIASTTSSGTTQVIRMYNPYSLEHLYTTDPNEAETLENDYGWDNENVAWIAPETSSTPIYRLYNPNNGDHMYTVSENEYDTLGNMGWTKEGIKLYSAPTTGAQIYRLYNPYMTANEGAYAHLWTGDYNEYVTLGNLGWQQESVAFYAISVPNPS